MIMNNKLSHERILICIALIACACVIGYNAFFTPEVNVPTVIYTDQDDSTKEDEEYIPQGVGSDAVTLQSSEMSGSESDQNNLLNINTATLDEISENLPGIGDVIAERIVDYREANGDFQSIEDIMNVSGIGEKIFENLKDKICI